MKSKIPNHFKIPIKAEINTNGINTLKKNTEDPLLTSIPPNTKLHPAIPCAVSHVKKFEIAVKIVSPTLVFNSKNVNTT